MKIDRLILGEIDTNCYIVSALNSECIIVDPADSPERIVSFINSAGLRPIKIVLTHCHVDHILAAPALREKYSAEILIHEADADALEDPMANLSALFDRPISFLADKALKDGDTIEFGGESFAVMFTPGHTPGGICLYSPGFLLSGDTLFELGYGRTDLPGGSHGELMKSIAKLMALPDDTAVYPGHGPSTTIGDEACHFA